jgi:GntR family transcriptional regulator
LGNIANGTWSPGDRIPTERALSDFFQASIGTVRHALQGLVEQGYLSRQQGRGTYVRNSSEHTDSLRYYRFAETFSSDCLRLNIKCLKPTELRPAPKAAAKMKLPPDTMFFYLPRVFKHENKPLVYVISYLPKDIFPDFDQITLPEHEGTPLYLLIEERYKMPTLSTMEAISAVAAREENASILQVNEGSPLLRIEMLASTIRDLPYEYRVSYLHTKNQSIVRRNAAQY